MHREYTAPNREGGMDSTLAQPTDSADSCSTITSTAATKADLPTKSCSSFRCASSPGKDVEPLIVFDWDDTVLASSWIQLRELLQAESNEDLPEDVRRELAVLEQSVVKCLANARGLGTVIIITNAEAGWVQLSAGKFFVNLLPLLEGVPVVSARSLFEGQFPGSPLCWKSAAFAYMMHDHFLDRSRWARKTVVSIGDSNEEKMALRIASGQHSSMAAKSVKFISSPDPEALSCQLDFVTQNLRTIVEATTDVEIVLEPSMVRKACSSTVHAREVDEDHRQEQPLGDTADLSDADDATTSMTTVLPPHELKSRCAEENLPRAQSRALLQDQACEASPVVSKARQQSLLESRTVVSNPIPIRILTPGTATCVSLGGGEGGGDCVQPFPATQTPVVEGLEGVESSAVAGGGGDVPSDGNGGACGGRTLPPDGNGCEEERPNVVGLKLDDSDASDSVDGAGVILEVNVVGEELGRTAIPSSANGVGTGGSAIMESSTESEEVAVVGARGSEISVAGEEGVFEFDDDVTGNPAPISSWCSTRV